MKEKYFTSKNLRKTAKSFIPPANFAGGKNPEFYPPSSALIVIDCQKYFFDGKSRAFIPSAPAIVSNLSALIYAYRKNNLPIMFTRHINTAKNAKLMGTRWREIITAGNTLSEIIFDAAGDTVVNKSQYDAFYGTKLENILRKRKIQQVVICGVMTNLCCETTARSAFVRGFEVFLPADATAAYNKRFHRASLLNLSYGFASVKMTEDIISAVAGND